MKKKIGAIAIIAVIILAVSVTITGQRRPRIQAVLEQGNRYLTELKYQDALAAFMEAIEIEPDNEAALSGITDTYLAWADSIVTRSAAVSDPAGYSVSDYKDAMKIILDGQEYLANTAEIQNNSSLADSVQRLAEAYDEYCRIVLTLSGEAMEEVEFDEVIEYIFIMLERDPQNADILTGFCDAAVMRANLIVNIEDARKDPSAFSDKDYDDVIKFLQDIIDKINSIENIEENEAYEDVIGRLTKLIEEFESLRKDASEIRIREKEARIQEEENKRKQEEAAKRLEWVMGEFNEAKARDTGDYGKTFLAVARAILARNDANYYNDGVSKLDPPGLADVSLLEVSRYIVETDHENGFLEYENNPHEGTRYIYTVDPVNKLIWRSGYIDKDHNTVLESEEPFSYEQLLEGVPDLSEQAAEIIDALDTVLKYKYNLPLDRENAIISVSSKNGFFAQVAWSSRNGEYIWHAACIAGGDLYEFDLTYDHKENELVGKCTDNTDMDHVHGLGNYDRIDTFLPVENDAERGEIISALIEVAKKVIDKDLSKFDIFAENTMKFDSTGHRIWDIETSYWDKEEERMYRYSFDNATLVDNTFSSDCPKELLESGHLEGTVE